MMSDLEQELLGELQTLSNSVWRNRADGRTIEQWLNGFGAEGKPGSRGRLHALYLLSRFMYFGDDEIRALLRALFRDHYKYPIVASVRRQAGDIRDQAVLDAAFTFALSRTRFLGMGNPSESGTHLLYHYRQENRISKDCFISGHEVFDLKAGGPTLANPLITRYIFIDDFCGSGQQAVEYSQRLVEQMKVAASQAKLQIRVAYHVLVGTQKGLERVKTETQFDEVESVLQLDETYRAFDARSRYFVNPPPGIDPRFALSLAAYFGLKLQPDAYLGYDNGQLMVGFVHNTPDNSLPIFWHPGNSLIGWHPVFRRYHKF